MTITRQRVKVKAIGQGQRLRLGLARMATRSVWPRSWIEGSLCIEVVQIGSLLCVTRWTESVGQMSCRRLSHADIGHCGCIDVTGRRTSSSHAAALWRQPMTYGHPYIATRRLSSSTERALWPVRGPCESGGRPTCRSPTVSTHNARAL